VQRHAIGAPGDNDRAVHRGIVGLASASANDDFLPISTSWVISAAIFRIDVLTR
jgi:hypothetical protein